MIESHHVRISIVGSEVEAYDSHNETLLPDSDIVRFEMQRLLALKGGAAETPDQQREVSQLTTLERRLKRCFEEALEQSFASGLTPKQAAACAQASVRAAVEEEIAQRKMSYAQIYTSQSGSVYFRTPSGCSFRVKAPRAGISPMIPGPQKVARRSFFLKAEDRERFLDLLADDTFHTNLLGEIFHHGPLAVGMSPLEFDVVGDCDRNLIEEPGAGLLCIRGKTFAGVTTNQGRGGVHIGHPISEILWDSTNAASSGDAGAEEAM